MAAGPGGAAPPAGPHWTGHPPGSRGSSWQQGVTHTKPLSERNEERAKGRGGRSIKGSQSTQNGAEDVIGGACRQEVILNFPQGTTG